MRRMTIVSTVLVIVAFAAAATAAPLGLGTIGLKLSSGGSVVIVYDGENGDSSNERDGRRDGRIVTSASVGKWNVNLQSADGPGFLGIGRMDLSYSDGATVVNNGILTLKAVDSGSAYIYGDYQGVPLAGGSGTGALADVKISGGNLKTLVSLTPGSGYKYGIYTSVPLTGGSGTGATANITVSGGNITALVGIAAGTAYVNGTYTGVPLTGGSGTGAKATVIISKNKVTAVNITSPGTGYYANDTLSASNSKLGGQGSGFSVKAGPVGMTSSVTIKHGGSGYYSDETLSASSATLGGQGSGLSVRAGPVVMTSSVTITNPGTGYLKGDTLSVPSAQMGGRGSGLTVRVATVDVTEPALPAPLNVWFTAPAQVWTMSYFQPVSGTQSYANTRISLYYDPTNNGNNYFTTKNLLDSSGLQTGATYSYVPSSLGRARFAPYSLTEYLEIFPVAGQHGQLVTSGPNQGRVQFSYKSSGLASVIGVPEPASLLLLGIGLIGLLWAAVPPSRFSHSGRN